MVPRRHAQAAEQPMRNARGEREGEIEERSFPEDRRVAQCKENRSSQRKRSGVLEVTEGRWRAGSDLVPQQPRGVQDLSFSLQHNWALSRQWLPVRALPADRSSGTAAERPWPSPTGRDEPEHLPKVFVAVPVAASPKAADPDKCDPAPVRRIGGPVRVPGKLMQAGPVAANDRDRRVLSEAGGEHDSTAIR